MNTDDDKFPILIRRDSYPGIVSPVVIFQCAQFLTSFHLFSQLSASSAALDLAPLSQQTPASNRNFSGPGRVAASEWPQFQGVRATDSSAPEGTAANGVHSERLRSVTHAGSPIEANHSLSSERSSPHPSRGAPGSSLPLPPPRSSALQGAPGSGRNSPVVEKKLGGMGLEGLGKPPLVKGYSGSELNTLGSAGYVDNLTDQFSNVSTVFSTLDCSNVHLT